MSPEAAKAVIEQACRAAPARIIEHFAQSGGQPLVALPGDAWTRGLLVALHAHVPRQRWVASVVRERLGGDLQRIAEDGGFGHPLHRKQSGDIPGMPDWQYFFHGKGCCLTHECGEQLDVDFDEHGADSIDPWFYQAYLDSSPRLEWAARRLQRPKPLSDWWQIDLDPLRHLGWIEGAHRVRLTTAGNAWADALRPAYVAIDTSRDVEARAWFAFLVDDLPSLASALGETALPNPLRTRLERQVAARARRLTQLVFSQRLRRGLEALAVLDPTLASPVVVRLLESGPLDGLAVCAAELAEHWQDPALEDSLLALVERARGADIPLPAIRIHACRALLLRFTGDTLPARIRESVLACLSGDAAACDADAALLVTLLDRNMGIERLETGLQSTIPMVRQEAAAALAVIRARAAVDCLRRSTSIESRAALAELGEGPPVDAPEPSPRFIQWRGESRPVFTLDEVVAAAAPDSMATEVAAVARQYAELLRAYGVAHDA